MTLTLNRIAFKFSPLSYEHYEVELRDGDTTIVLSHVAPGVMRNYARFRAAQWTATHRPFLFGPCQGLRRSDQNRVWRACVISMVTQSRADEGVAP